ncbi:MAG: alpha/beta fold hydrolase [Acidovorax sp.]|uniref:alpha/beta fold hydrolase n=1 Tax=Acidovorax sp. TaxID=1872122 RepID=UPI00391D0FAF
MPRSPRPRQWILLRGLTRESAHWGDFAADLQQALPADQVLALDLPGNGQFHTVPSPLSVQAMVQACRNELARRAVAPPYHLLAMSLGAMVATEWARAAPGEVAGCILINTSMRPFSPFYHRLRPYNLAALLQLARKWRSQSASDAEAAERIVLRITSNRAPDRGAAIPLWAAVRQQRPVSARNALRQLVAAARYQAPATAPGVPLLLLGSTQDQLVAHQCSKSIAKAWGIPLHKHPSAGHDLPLDDPQWVINELVQWVEWTA